MLSLLARAEALSFRTQKHARAEMQPHDAEAISQWALWLT